jgi:O-antigen/teichoic acid export membrane protein
LVGAAVPLAVSLVTIPIYLGLIGEARYGVLAIAWLLLGYFGLFDLGLGRATAQRIAALKDSSGKARAQAFWTALALNVALGTVGGLLAWPVATYFFGHVFKIEESLRPEVLSAVPWLLLAVPIATLSGVLSGALEGRARFLELNVISVSGTVLFQVLPLCAALTWGADLGLLLPVAILARLLTVAMLFGRCRKHVFGGHAFEFSAEQSGGLLRFGGWVTVTAVIGPIMVIFDRFIIGAIGGAKAVSYYTIPFQLAERVSIVPGALASALFPRLAGSISAEERQRLARDGMSALAAVMTPLVIAGIYLMRPFLELWISAEFSQKAALVGQIILVGYWFNSFAKIPYAKIQARGRPDLVAKCHLAEVLPYLGALYLGLTLFGIEGAATAFSLRVMVDFILLAYFAGMLNFSVFLLMLPAGLVVGAFAIERVGAFDGPLWWAVLGAHVLATLIWAWSASPDMLKDLLESRFK